MLPTHPHPLTPDSCTRGIVPKDTRLQLLQPRHQAAAGQMATALRCDHQGPARTPSLTLTSHPPVPCRRRRCTDTSSEDVNRNTPQPSHALQAQTLAGPAHRCREAQGRAASMRPGGACCSHPFLTRGAGEPCPAQGSERGDTTCPCTSGTRAPGWLAPD